MGNAHRLCRLGRHRCHYAHRLPGSIVAAVLVPILMYFFGEPLPLTIFGLLAAILVVVRHKDNIIRLIQGRELKVERIQKK